MEDEDRISDLPDAILSHILSFLSTREAVATSILSTKWRYLFALPSDFDFELLEGQSIRSFVSWVDRVLLFHNSTNFGKVSLKSWTGIGTRLFSELISALVCRGVKHLDLQISLSGTNTLRDVLFTCRTLTSLRLALGRLVLDVPNGVSFRNLKTLHLKSVEFKGDDSVKSLLSSCTSLEDVVMDRCNITNGWSRAFRISHHLLKRLTVLYPRLSELRGLIIDTPNLTYFKYSGSVKPRVLLYNHLQSRFEADINIFNSYLDSEAKAFFGRICNARSLCLVSTSLKLLLKCDPLPVFATLVELEIRYNPRCSSCRNNYWKNGLETLLSRCCQLEKLALYQELLCYLPENTCLLSKLKVIEVSNFEYDEDCIGKAKYILKNAGALQKLTIFTAVYISEDEKSKLYEELSASPRKSNQCCILI